MIAEPTETTQPATAQPPADTLSLLPTPWTGGILPEGTVVRILKSVLNGIHPEGIIRFVGFSDGKVLNLQRDDHLNYGALYLPDDALTNGWMEVLPVLWRFDLDNMPRRLYLLHDWLGAPKNKLYVRNGSSYSYTDLGSGQSIVITNTIARQRILCSITVPISDAGDPVNPAHKVLIGDNLIDSLLKAQIETYPTAALTRGLLRSRFLRPPPLACITAEAVLEWVRSQNAFNSLPPLTPEEIEASIWTSSRFNSSGTAYACQSTTSRASVRPDRHEATMSVDIDVSVDVTGHTHWSRTDHYTGTMEIPLSVIAEGERDIRDYIRDNYHRELECDCGDEGYGDSESDDSTVDDLDCDNNIDDLIERYADEHPSEENQ